MLDRVAPQQYLETSVNKSMVYFSLDRLELGVIVSIFKF